MTEDQLELETLDWLASVGYTPLNARDLDSKTPRSRSKQERPLRMVPAL